MNSKLNIIIDTNVIVSSLLTTNTKSPTAIILDLFLDDKVNLYYSDKILSEYVDVLNRKKFDFNTELVHTLINMIVKKAHKINPKKLENLLIDKKDQPFYEIVMDKRINKSKLITGNIKHFPIQANIMTPREFITFYNENNV